ncbi:MAG: metallophosphoesterase [Planctomycetia bacterium]|nr:metallophosphoesterase [Planctomycetia bacterium]
MSRRHKVIALFLFFVALLGLRMTALAADTEYQAPKLEQEEGWTLVVMPDPQQYTSQRNFPILEIMMNWLVENKAPLNIRQVVCVGDLVNNNMSNKEWSFSSQAFARLDGHYPYVLCTGNHEYGHTTATADNRKTAFNEHYPSSRNPAWKDILVGMGKNTFGEETLENAVYELTLPEGNLFVFIAIPFSPPEESLRWAKEVAEQPKYDNDKTIVALVTHDYMKPAQWNNVVSSDKDYTLHKEGGASGQEIWEKLIKPCKNIRMVFCGHYSDVNNPRGCSGFRTDKNDAGRTVYQMVFDTQALGGGYNGNGGDGWLRLLEFSRDMKHVKVKSFSPFFALSPSTQNRAWGTEPYNQFEFDIE